MTKDEIIRMAREVVEKELVAAAKTEVVFAEAYRCGYAAGAAAEREACVKLCDDLIGTRAMAVHCADAIRARGTT